MSHTYQKIYLKEVIDALQLAHDKLGNIEVKISIEGKMVNDIIEAVYGGFSAVDNILFIHAITAGRIDEKS